MGDFEAETSGSLEVSGPGGWRGRLTGIDTKLVLLGLLMMIATLAFAYATYVNGEQHRVTQKMLAMIMTNQNEILALRNERDNAVVRAIKESSASTNYVLMMDATERKGLRLTMPDLLRDQVNRR